jgi:hypothetical protein
MRVPLLIAVAISWSVALGGDARADGGGGQTAASERALWSVGTSEDEKGRPIIHIWRRAALDLPNRSGYRWRVGIAWPFPDALVNGMPSPAERVQMTAIDDAIAGLFHQDAELRTVSVRTGGGGREVMLYAKSATVAWKRIDALFKQFPTVFPGGREAHAYVKEDADWSTYRALIATVHPMK